MTAKKLLKIGIIGGGLLLAGLLVAGWMLPGLYRQRASDFFRERFSLYSDQKLQPFTTQISLFEHFPNVTFTFQNLSVLDTASRTPIEVLRIANVKVTVNIRDLTQEKIPIRHMYLQGVKFYQHVDSAGIRTSFHFRQKDSLAKTTPTELLVSLPQISITDARIITDNTWKRSGFSLYVAQADLSGSLRNDTLRLNGELRGQTGYLRTKDKLRFRNHAFTASARYVYNGVQKKGTLEWSRILLQSDTLSLTGTHARLTGRPGSELNMELNGRVHLSDLLKESLPPKLKPYVTQTTTSSKVQIRYTITGESGPTKRPHTHLWFTLQDGELAWKDTPTRLQHLTLTGELDNGKQQTPRSSVLRIHSFRCRSDLDSLHGTVQVSNFEQPFLRVQVQGRLNVQTVATIANLPQSSDYRGTLVGRIDLEGFAKAPVQAYFSDKLRWKGAFQLQQGVFVHPVLATRVTDVRAEVHFANHLLHVSGMQGNIGGHAFQGEATVHHLLAYLFNYQPDIQIDGKIRADQLESKWIAKAPPSPAVSQTKTDTTHTSPKSPAIIPGFLQLKLQLNCTRFIFNKNDTLHAIQAYVQTTKSLLHVSPLSCQIQGAHIGGSVHMPNNWQYPGQTRMQLTVQLPHLNLRQTVQAVTHARHARPPARHPMSPQLNQQVHALIQEAEAHVTVRIGSIQLPGEEMLQRFSMQIDKKGTQIRVPDLRFVTSAGGIASGTGAFGLRSTAHTSPQVVEPRLNLNLNYSFLNLQYFMQQVASMGDLLPPPDPAAASRPRGKAKKSPATAPMHLLQAVDNYYVSLKVHADKIHYQTLDGRNLALQTHIQKGKARIDDFGMHAFGGQLALQGTLEWGRKGQHEGVPVELRLQLQDINLPHLFRVADQLNLDVIRSHNIEGQVTCNVAVHTELDHTFTPQLSQTMLYCKALIQNMELIDVQPIQHALRFLRKKRTEHLYFKDVHAHFLFHKNRFLTPGVKLDNNICGFTLSGSYTMNGPADMYMDLNVFEILFGNNKRRIEQIQQETDTVQAVRNQHVLVYRLPDDYRQNAYKVKVFNKRERSLIEQSLAEEFRTQLRTQKIDTVFTPLTQTP